MYEVTISEAVSLLYFNLLNYLTWLFHIACCYLHETLIRS